MDSNGDNFPGFDVFISYSTKDKAVADAVVSAHEKVGIRCWYAPRDIPPGADWADSITKAIEECSLMILIFSGNANGSQRVLDELNFSINKGKPVLPFRVEDLEPTGAMELHLSSRHWLDAYHPSWEVHIDRLVKSVQANLNVEIKTGIEIQKPIEQTKFKQKLYVKKLYKKIGLVAVGLLILISMVFLGINYIKTFPNINLQKSSNNTKEPTAVEEKHETKESDRLMISTEQHIETNTEDVSSIEETEFIVGILAPFTGDHAHLGNHIKHGVTIALEEWDYQVGPYAINPVWIDSESDPEKTSHAYEEAITKEGIQAGLLNFHSSVAVVAMEIAAKYKIPHIFGLGSTKYVNETFDSDPQRYAYWSLKGWPVRSKLKYSYVSALEHYIREGEYSPNDKTVAIYGWEMNWCQDFADNVRGLFEDAGWEIVDEQFFPLEGDNYTNYFAKIRNLRPAVMIGTPYTISQMASFLSQADEAGIMENTLIIANELGWGDFCDMAGASANLVLDQIPYWSGENGTAFVEKYEARTDLAVTPLAPLSYDGTLLFLKIARDTYEEYGELTSEKLQEFIEEKVWSGEWTMTEGIVMKEYKYTRNTIPDPVVGLGYYMFPIIQYEYNEGRCDARVIYPAENASQSLIVP